MMNFEEFKGYIQDNILKYLPERYQDADIVINRVVKNNDTVLDGMNIFSGHSGVTPTIYLNAVYEQYQDGRDIDQIVGSLADQFVEIMGQEVPFNVSQLFDYEDVKDRIVCRLVNRESNAERLSNAPFTTLEDLAVTYHVMVSQDEDGIGSLMITNDLMKGYGVDVDTLHQQAMENMPKLSPIDFRTLNEVMMDMMTPSFAEENGIDLDEAEEMVKTMVASQGVPDIYCLTNAGKINGAAVILNPETQEYISDRVGGDYFILPSSIHELLVVCAQEGMEYEELQSMVQEVNQNCVSPDEILSNRVYQYDAKTHTISLADKVQNQKIGITAKAEEIGKPAFVMEKEQSYNAGENVQEKEPEVKKHSTPRH